MITIDKIFVINLPERKDRLERTVSELDNHYPFMQYDIVPAIKDDNGALGLKQTYSLLLIHCVMMNYENILVFEDDFKVINNMDIYAPLNQLPEYDIFYFGCNLFQNEVNKVSENLIQVTAGYSTHAMVISKSGMKKILNLLSNPLFTDPIDTLIVDHIQPQGNCYASIPMLCSQYAGESDIMGKYVDWSNVLEKRFNEKTKHL